MVGEDDGRRDGKAGPLARQQPHHRHVVHLGNDPGLHLKPCGKRVKADTDRALRRQDDRLLGQKRGQALMP